ncbi:helix-turn-helix transcriptional regulator [Actinokineospora sp.]|uniref:helix-turn-helix transcriptional regulator n=1 Tax=Actinokineospora sp. TaxID=1872133 RepID=UPI0040381EBA
MEAGNWPAPPAALTSFVGRVAELDAVGALMDEHRIVSVLGPGGSGKTRLAWELVGGTHQRGHPWCFTALNDEVATAAQVAERVAASLALPAGAGDALDALCATLRGESVLIVLDGCERTVEPVAAVLTRLVTACPSVSVLVTSREPLSVAGEVLYRLPPMALPVGDDLADAVTLFLVRAGRAPESLDADERQMVTEICRELDGAPLAIELAAARLDHVELVDVARGLSDRFALLSRGPRSAPARHRTIEACIDWSHDLLDEHDRSVFRRLSVFAGPFGLAAATAVTSLDRAAAMAAVSRLVDRSLVERAPAARDGTARYHLLATLRAYGRRRLDAAGESVAISGAHLSWWVGLARQARDGLEGAQSNAWLTRLRAEVDDLRAALRHAADVGDWAALADLVTALTLFWHGAGLHRDGLRLAERAVAAIDPSDEDRRDRLSWAIGHLALYLGDLDRAALATDRGQQDGAIDARVLTVAGGTANWTDPARARPLLRRAMAAARAAGDAWCEVDAAQKHAYSRVMQDRWAQARTEVDALAERVEALGNPVLLAWQEYVRTRHAVYGGDLDQASRHGAALITHAEATGEPITIATAAGALTEAALLRGDPDAARAHLGWGRAGAGRWVDKTMAGSFLDLTDAVITLAVGPDPAALDALATIVAGYQAAGATYPEAFALAYLADAAHSAGAHATVRAAAARLAEIAVHTDNRRCAALRDRWTGMTDLATGRPDLALGALVRAAELLLAEGFAADAARTLHAAAAACAALGRPAISARVLGAVDAARDRHGWRGILTRPTDLGVRAEVAAVAGDRFDALHREGATLSLSAAVQLLMRARSPRKRPRTGWASLTATESHVVDLVVTGASNPEIGAHLFMSRATVKTHLASIYRKLELTSRTQLAAAAVSRTTDS